MPENMKIWDSLKTTDPAHTKRFKRAGGFSGTSIKPIYMVQKMTETFGPAGKGWGMMEPGFRVVECPDYVMVYCTVALWWEKREQTVYGVGGDVVLGKNRNGPFTDDEAFKKAYTDAMSNAMKQIGMGADVHMGQHDDDKYVSAVKNGLAGTSPQGSDTPIKTTGKPAPQETDWTGPLGKTKLYEELRRLCREFQKCFDEGDLDSFMALKSMAETTAIIKQAKVDMPKEWAGPLDEGEPYKDFFAGLEKELKEANPVYAG